MSYYNDDIRIIETTENKVVAMAGHKVGAEIIAKALNYFFSETFTANKAVEMMHKNTSSALLSTAKFFKEKEYTIEDAIEYLVETAEVLAAQAIVVSMRDELKFDKPTI